MKVLRLLSATMLTASQNLVLIISVPLIVNAQKQDGQGQDLFFNKVEEKTIIE